MKRRAVLKRFGVAGVAGAAFTGTATAKPPELGLDRTLDVSDLSGEYVLADLLTEEEIAATPADVAVHETKVVIAAQADTIETFGECCCCDGSTPLCHANCCTECRMQ